MKEQIVCRAPALTDLFLLILIGVQVQQGKRPEKAFPITKESEAGKEGISRDYYSPRLAVQFLSSISIRADYFY